MQSTPRPLSPHLQVYRPQLTSVLSITHRGTGVVLAMASLLLVWWLLAVAAGPAAYADAAAMLDSSIGQLVLIAVSFCVFFHLSNGVRHLFWDAGLGFELRTVYASGHAVLAVSVALTALMWLVIWLT